MIYLDNAATTFPKPRQVITAATEWLMHGRGTPGRGQHSGAVKANNALEAVRCRLARFFGVTDEFRVIFTYSATDALNLAIKGFVEPGDHVLISAMEHNSVLRPLRGLERQGKIRLEIVPCDGEGYLEPAAVFQRFTPETRLVVVSHASNVTGTVQPVAAIGAGVREKGAYLLVDAAQTGGILPTRLPELGADLVTFAGHKGLFGLQGTGGLVIGERIMGLRPWREGGTGAKSASETQPFEWPEAFEAGTPNVPGIIALGAGIDYIEEQGLDAIHHREQEFLAMLWEGLQKLENIQLYGPEPGKDRVGVLVFNIAGWDPDDVGEVLNYNHGIQVRTGLHCAPLAHRTINSGKRGAIRLSPGYFNTDAEIKAVLAALREMAAIQIQYY
ncbi:MAG: aminotransferase class V-fold PLP-dependent enzyme [Heliobacteriaceae bacterium]|nr:aminotransferase class V-fold PLP-dependent enzyme [Heliobacteriaceae bacterium]